MNVALWILQAVLALLAFAGGMYKIVNTANVVDTIPGLPAALWPVFGVLEVAVALLLIVPPLLRRGQTLTPLAGGLLAVESLVLAALYARVSLAFEAENPLVWAIAMAVLAGLLVLGRRAWSNRLRSNRLRSGLA